MSVIPKQIGPRNTSRVDQYSLEGAAKRTRRDENDGGPRQNKQASACSLDGTKVAVANCFAELAP